MNKLFFKTVDTLQRFKPKIKAEVAKAKSNKELADKVYGHKGNKRNNNGTSKVINAIDAIELEVK